MSPLGIPIISLLYHKEIYHEDELRKKLQNKFGHGSWFYPELHSPHQYYQKEMGTPLGRFLFGSLQEGHDLVDLKQWAIAWEDQSKNKLGKRTLNCDPGLLTLTNFQLATTKNFSHRVYLRDGIYSDLTLIWKGNEFRPLEWTYPDYGHSLTCQYLSWWRSFLLVPEA